ncbi:hypothetical protein DL95DRAFT_471041 [Leptodontidium sp. 2 PMI_412]|nr:hypothetical protein DL95DRAFT_471041 [Leptodontidium sp. 2 PMI_412]
MAGGPTLHRRRTAISLPLPSRRSTVWLRYALTFSCALRRSRPPCLPGRRTSSGLEITRYLHDVPKVGGAFASTHLGYRGVLWLSFGISTVLCALAFLLLEPTPREASVEKRPLDIIGAFLVISSCAILVYGFTEAPTGWNQAKVIAPIVIGVTLLVSFFVFEQFIVWKFLPRVDPLIPTTYSTLVPLTIQTGFTFGCFFLTVLNGSTFLLRVQERKPLISAVIYMPPKWLLVIAPLVLATGVVLFSRNDTETGYWQYMFSGSVVMSLGTAIFFMHYLNVAYAATPPEDQGLVSGILQTSAQVATALGLAIGSSFLSSETPKDLLPEYFETAWNNDHPDDPLPHSFLIKLGDLGPDLQRGLVKHFSHVQAIRRYTHGVGAISEPDRLLKLLPDTVYSTQQYEVVQTLSCALAQPRTTYQEDIV